MGESAATTPKNTSLGFVDAGFANTDKKKLTMGFVFISGGGVIAWRSKEQTLMRARSVGGSSGFKTGPAKSHPNLAKLAFSKPDHAILASAGFETGATERALTTPHSSTLFTCHSSIQVIGYLSHFNSSRTNSADCLAYRRPTSAWFIRYGNHRMTRRRSRTG
jgi:hypothetical protein